MEQLHNQMLVKQLKAFCVQERTRIENRHRFGISGTEIVEEYTRLADNVIQRIYQAEHTRAGFNLERNAARHSRCWRDTAEWRSTRIQTLT